LIGEVEMDWVYLFTGVHGRITRQWFWIGATVLVLVEIVSQQLAYRIEGDRLSIIVDVAFTYPEFALTVKRANDRNLSTWLIGLFFAGGVLLDFLALLKVNGTTNVSDPLSQLIFVPWAAFGLVLIIDLGFRRGTVGPNRFGPDPLGGKV
jgi:uncharacterized membrane protein YhaH (DUF805 family)